MNLDIVSIGDELLIGQTLNTNAYWISQQFNAVGFTIRRHISIADNKQAIINAVDEGLVHADVVMITGGLGPTNDDLTMPVLNEFFGGELIQDETVLSDITAFISKREGVMNENNIKQAQVPNNCKVIRNRMGTAPGLWFEKNNKVVIATPGVPHETKAMVRESIIPLLKEKYQLPVIIHQMVQTVGLPEALLAEKILDWENQLPNEIKLAYLPSPGRVKLRLSILGNNRSELQLKIDEEVAKLTELIGENIYAINDCKLEEALGKLLKERSETVATAESCTGGYIAHLITSISGSSEYYKGSVVAYDNQVKVEQLGVDAEAIEMNGAVSKQVVEQMAAGIRLILGTNYGIATSGIAGPLGGSEEKPVGTTWIAVAGAQGVEAKCFNFGADRTINIERGAIKALEMLMENINNGRI